MADITDPEAIRFVKEIVRPLSERMRDLHVLVQEAAAEWLADNGAMAAHFANPADTVEDGRAAEGVSRLTALDVTDYVAEVATTKAQFDAAMDIIRKPCVRPLRVTEG